MNKKNSFMCKKYFLIIAFALLFSCKNNTPYSENNALETKSAVSADVDRDFDFLPKASNNQIVQHEFYTLSYNENFEQAEWVAYFLDGKMSRNHFDRPFFEQDPMVKTASADWKNYKKSGYDKGHLCAAGDMHRSKTAFDDTFLTSNISPQLHDFNDGVWNRLEQKTRYWAEKYSGIYVVTAGILTADLPTIGREKVAVPAFFYKILFRKTDAKMIAFLVPHQDSDKALYEFVVPVDKIEQLTGLDFFPKLEDVLENDLESKSDWKAW